MGRFDGRVAIVTGSARGIGGAAALRLASEGATVAFADINEAGAEAKAAEAGGSCFAVGVDIGDPESVAGLHETVLARCGKLDVLVNAAAIVPFVPWNDLTFEEWRRVLRVNLDGLYLMCRASSEAMRRNGYGRIVSLCSNSIFAGTPNMAHYVAAKGGVMTFSRALATELGGDRITVNCVAPGLTDTEGVQESPHKDAFDFCEMLQAIKGHGTPKDIVPAIAFLASEEAHWITGQTLVADGGMVRW
ncbi:pyridoxal 4-dehydrogenase [Tistlia consotensis]|uniref:Pyridoxal 4-dehydrogenase n=1 Tax=Tistlia consotensis USBA 355 TaxID=560819 RepID=A0A1Y6CEK3_9PROT|nr:SDR family oxidoreductase [Tistlia consotensis]SMF57305.1 pyridoxal 4-dehydrogenase [Tistlia consotensis USBA 355]SNR45570.1 pyridoxal 4-dehydrogenase [Tistlia consotensis]